ncbi:hypothetical protein DL96DRAFT_1607712 [Flagelloscypha sp. PMI_526]|nr:hypothetical protein DL96DRAFT_1607712 [Flagelloscypha sp. PMI_526]
MYVSKPDDNASASASTSQNTPSSTVATLNATAATSVAMTAPVNLSQSSDEKPLDWFAERWHWAYYANIVFAFFEAVFFTALAGMGHMLSWYPLSLLVCVATCAISFFLVHKVRKRSSEDLAPRPFFKRGKVHLFVLVIIALVWITLTFPTISIAAFTPRWCYCYYYNCTNTCWGGDDGKYAVAIVAAILPWLIITSDLIAAVVLYLWLKKNNEETLFQAEETQARWATADVGAITFGMREGQIQI